MKLYCHPASTTSRPIMLFAAENRVPIDMQIVDIFSGEQYKPPFEAVNPNHLGPVLEDGDFRLTESSAILKYVADKIDSPLYPKDPKARARLNERMDWVNTQLCRDLAYGTVYPNKSWPVPAWGRWPPRRRLRLRLIAEARNQNKQRRIKK